MRASPPRASWRAPSAPQERGDWYIFTQFEPLGARRVFPCFDEPSFKVPWQLTLPRARGQRGGDEHAAAVRAGRARAAAAPSASRARSRCPATSSRSAWARSSSSRPRPRAARRCPRASSPPGPRRRGRLCRSGDAARSSPRLEDYFDMPYPYEKLDTLAVPLLGGAMEHPGLITFNSRAAAGQAGRGHASAASAPSPASRCTSWGTSGSATSSPWRGGTTCGSTSRSPRGSPRASWRRGSPRGTRACSRLQGRSNALAADSLVTARRIRQPIENAGDIRTAFDGITYGKGAAVLAMTEEWLGRDVFQRGIQRYLRAHAGGTATAKDFLARALRRGGGPGRGRGAGHLPGSGRRADRLRHAGLLGPDAEGGAEPAPLPAAGLQGRRGAHVEGAAVRALRRGRAARAAPARCWRPSARSWRCPRRRAVHEWLFPNAEGAGYFRAPGDRARRCASC